MTALALVVAVFLACPGCGSGVRGIDVTTIVFKEDGSLTSVVVEDFSAEYYDIDELKAQVEEEASSYNTRAGEERITITECEKDDDVVRLVMEYMAPEDYAAFNRVVLQAESNTITVSERVHVRTVKKITDVSEGVEQIKDKEASIGEAAVLPATITTEE